MLTFVVGQVQLAYSSYFCTMKQMTVKTPIMAMTSNSDLNEGVCEQCQEVMQPSHGQQLVEANCIKVITTEKSVVSSFSDSQRSIQHFVGVAVIGDQLSSTGYLPSAIGYQLLAQADSPPLDLPTLNRNLRI